MLKFENEYHPPTLKKSENEDTHIILLQVVFYGCVLIKWSLTRGKNTKHKSLKTKCYENYLDFKTMK
jgi:hypothetical protein